MNDYDFSTLNDKEFENLTIDLISRDRGKRFERFKAGRDGGIDGRYYRDDGKQEIIQCKHYLKTGYNGLISSLKKRNRGKNEADKVKLLAPQRYTFVTSLPLSPSNKKEIKEIFEPYIKSDNDIYSQTDLNDLLKNNPDIEKNHYKLWISSTTVLQRVLHNAIVGRSKDFYEDIKDESKYFVETDSYPKAINELEKSRTVIITGEPGVGKSTLAKQLVLFYLRENFEIYKVYSIREAEDIFEEDKPQIFYFDDFLGSNYLEALENQTDSKIVDFISRVKRDENKRFILTSRTNILNHGLLASDKFRSKKLNNDEFTITVNGLTHIDKANILYNHIWYSNLSEEYIDELYKEKRYKQIIKHKNFNPRLIEFITDVDRIKPEKISATNYWEYIQKTLDNPTEIWANTFDEHSDEFIRNIVTLVVFNGNSISEVELKRAYATLNKLMNLTNYSDGSKEFNRVIEKTVRYFLNRTIKDNKIEYSLFNPSIADFVLNKYLNGDNQHKILYIFQSLKTEHGLVQLESMKYSLSNYQEILLYLLKNLRNHKKEDSSFSLKYKLVDEWARYGFKLLSMGEGIKGKEVKTKSIYQKIIFKLKRFFRIKESFSDIEAFSLGKVYNEISLNTLENLNMTINRTINMKDISKELLIELSQEFNDSSLEEAIFDKNIVENLNRLVHTYLVNELNNNFNNQKLEEQEVNSILTQYLDELVNGIEGYEGREIYKTEIINSFCLKFQEEKLEDKDFNIDVDDLFERG